MVRKSQIFAAMLPKCWSTIENKIWLFRFWLFVIFVFWIMLTEHNQWHVRNDCHDITFKRIPNRKWDCKRLQTLSVYVYVWTFWLWICVHTQTHALSPLVCLQRTILLPHSSITFCLSTETSHVFSQHCSDSLFSCSLRHERSYVYSIVLQSSNIFFSGSFHSVL